MFKEIRKTDKHISSHTKLNHLIFTFCLKHFSHFGFILFYSLIPVQYIKIFANKKERVFILRKVINDYSFGFEQNL